VIAQPHTQSLCHEPEFLPENMKMPGFIDAAAQVWLAGCHSLHIAVNGSGCELDPRR